jgi:DNA polymerase-3 subunit alpha
MGSEGPPGMSHADFVHLRVHTAYSLSQGAVRVSELTELCIANDMPAVAVTDTGNLFGALEFALTAVKAGVQPVMGTVLAVTRTDGDLRTAVRPEPDRLVLLAQDETGYRNLMKLSSRSFLLTEGGLAPQVSMTDLASHADGLIALTGGPSGPLNRLFMAEQAAAARSLAGELAAAFPGRLYVELQRHGLPEEEQVEAALVDLAYRLDLPLVATNDVHFPVADMYDAHDALLCIADGTYVGQRDRRRLTPEHWFKTASEMRALFDDLPEAVDNTLVVARRCAFHPTVRQPILPGFDTAAGRDEPEELRAQARTGLDARLARVHGAPAGNVAPDFAAPYRDRLEFELSVIIQMGFAGYFLIVADFIGYAKRKGIPVGPGRGSGAGSVVAWALGITDLDPLRFGLLFERFLNPERISMPDFDIDFCQDRRDEVLEYVERKYGRDRVAQIITFGKLQARAVLRDVGRVLEMPYGQVDRLCKMVPNNPANPVKLADAVEGEPRLQEARRSDESVARLIDIALRLEGLYRHASTHAAGVVIGDRALDELVPLYRDPRAPMMVTQFSMKYAELAGLVKFDFLGLKTLTVIDRTLKLLRERDREIDISGLSLDDPETYAMLGRGETVGVFQLESSGMRQVLVDMKPDAFEDIIALVALYRPGPMENIPRFIACKKGEEEPDYIHPMIEPILRETRGVIIYQEQVMEIAKVLAGYTLGDADLLRRAMGKKIKAEMDAQREKFVSGAVANGVDRARATYIFDLVAKFAGYGFNKSHAACYALIAYQTAWLKANYPVEFLAASMSLDIGNTDKLGVFKKEIERLGIELRHPDINRSDVDFTVEYEPPAPDPANAETPARGAVRYALSAIRNVGRHAMESVVAERRSSGVFADLFDFASRIDSRVVNKRQIENLTRAGAFDGLNRNRAQVLAATETLIRFAASATESRESGQASLFGGEATSSHLPRLPEVQDWSAMERLSFEREAVGFYLSAHPLDSYAVALARLRVRPYADLVATLSAESRTVRLAGTVESVQERTSSRGNRFAFLQLSDTSGSFEATVFSELLSGARELLEPGRNLLVTVEARNEGEAPRLVAQMIRPLEPLASQAVAGLRVSIADETPIDRLLEILGAERPGGGGRISVIVRLDGGQREVELELPQTYRITPPFREAIAGTPGIVAVAEV